MALKYSFFNSILAPDGTPDRPFDADDFSKYFSTLIKDGVFPNPSTNFQILGNQGNMKVQAQPGIAWIQGHLAYDDSVYLLNIDISDSALDRIDRIALRLDVAERVIKWVVKKGDFSAQPVAKALQRDADAWEIGIADIRINKGSTEITQANITDLRQNTQYCGLVTGTVTQIDTSTFFNQLEQWKIEYIKKTNQWTDEQERLFQEWFKLQEKSFDTWFDTIKGKLSGDIAGSLQNQITDLENNVKGLHTDPIEYTLKADKWSGNVYSFEEDYPFSTYEVEVIGFSENATQAERHAYDDAVLASVLTDATIKALEVVPKINIPIVIKAVRRYVNS